jgi:hypothetical protein
MILITTLVVMLLITILGVGMLFATRTELTTTTNYRQSAKAFNQADALVQLAILATDVLAKQTLDAVRDRLEFSAAQSDYKIEVSDSLATFAADKTPERISIKRRYLRLGNLSTAPDIVVRDKQDRVVGTIMISHDFAFDTAPFHGVPGSSEGVADKGSMGVGTVGVQYFVITVSGKDPAAPDGGSSFFLEDDEASGVTGPQTFITIIYKVVRNG